MSFLDNFCKPDSVKVEIDDQEVEMYPSRVCMAPELRTLFSDLGPDLSIIFDDRTSDTGTSNEYLQDESVEGQIINTKKVQTAAELDILKYRSESRASAIRRLAENVLEDRCKLAVGRILMDSMRDEFQVAVGRKKTEVEEFINHDHMTIDRLVLLLVGWTKANAAKMGSLGKKMVSALETQVETETETPGKESSISSPEQSEPDTE